MTNQFLNLPTHLPWKLLAVSPDMMDTEFCNKRFPFQWRSSMAVSAYEPRVEDLPEELCDERITYLKITCSITGYQPSEQETDELYFTYPDLPTEELDRIIREYFACYGVLLNVAVFPNPKTKKVLTPETIRFFLQGGPRTGTEDSNPLVRGGVQFEAVGQPNNLIVDIYPETGDLEGELALPGQMIITFDPAVIPQVDMVEARVVHYGSESVTMEAFAAGLSVGLVKSGMTPGEPDTLTIEAEGIDRVVIDSPGDQESLLEFTYYTPSTVELGLSDYPHIIAFEPKTRDLYQAATETGEVLTFSKSGVNTDKTQIAIESTESSVEASANVGLESIPAAGGLLKVGLSGKTSSTQRETDQKNWTVQTDSSRERRETQGATTQLSQMYNLLTSYHQGTNRAVFLMLPRPHVLQPTDRRTFIQGLRFIEGIQEFFLVVTRPADINGLCVETLLETGHFPEEVEEERVLVEPNGVSEKWSMLNVSVDRLDWRLSDTDYHEIWTTVRPAPLGLVYDRRKGEGSGVEIARNNSDHWLTYVNYPYNSRNLVVDRHLATDGSVEITVKVRKEPEFWRLPNREWVNDADDRPFTTASLEFESHYVEEGAPEWTTKVISPFIVASRGLCVCFRSTENCPEVVPHPIRLGDFGVGDSIVDETRISVSPTLLTPDAVAQSRTPAMKELLRKVQSTMTTSWRNPRRHPGGEVGFLESEYIKDRIRKLLPEEHLERPLAQVSGLTEAVADSLGPELTVREALDFDLASLSRKTGLSTKGACRVRRTLLGLSSTGAAADDVSQTPAQQSE